MCVCWSYEVGYVKVKEISRVVCSDAEHVNCSDCVSYKFLARALKPRQASTD